ncbi:hypothetical protein AJ80_01868 [Polytolypa hystricis UAMH7299]|uniref:FAD-binding domain-containing protein n=1 Tax=Polytolypa hystricis (strain UAMH7299) TaxID=1447883 RepID=A0A2B7YZA3_POLH7|nr:hypothetical protein AJ80_01868 [Polytolypa hystricis UAMH7299]
MKIVIVGAGIAGLSSYLLLRKHLPNPPLPTEQHEIIVYESHESINKLNPHDTDTGITLGATLGVMPNGLKVLQRLDEELVHDIVRNGHVVTHMRLKNSRGWTLAEMRNAGDQQPPLNCVMIQRQTFWSLIRARVPSDVLVNKKVSGVETRTEGGVTVRFADDSPDVVADLVIGADGLKSVVRKSLFKDEREDLCSPHFSGLLGVEGRIPSTLIREECPDGIACMVFGHNGFMGYSYDTTAEDAENRHLPSSAHQPGEEGFWWSTHETTEHENWLSVDIEATERELHERLGEWKDPAVQKILQSAEIKRLYPTYTTPILPTWHRGSAVLVGDAAHTLHSTSGQGSSQALEDVEALSSLLSHYLQTAYTASNRAQAPTETEAIGISAKLYENIRMPRIKHIVDSVAVQVNQKRTVSVPVSWVRYFFLWFIGKLGFMDNQAKFILDYDTQTEVEKAIKSYEETKT